MAVATMAWLSRGSNHKPAGSNHLSRRIFRHNHDKSPTPTLGILAFETAKTMSRLISLYTSLTDEEFVRLRKGPMKSSGVAFLNSNDECYLLGLACAEKLEDLEQCAATVSRLAQKCTEAELKKFEAVYKNMKDGIIDATHLDFNSKNLEKIIDKMEKYVSTTAMFHASLEALNELELAEKRMKKWKKNHHDPKKVHNKTNLEYFNEKLAFQKKEVRHYKEISLRSQTIDKCVGLMARVVCTIYARICVLFGPFDPSLPRISRNANPHLQKRFQTSNPKSPNQKSRHSKTRSDANSGFLEDKEKNLGGSKSGPIAQASRPPGATRSDSSGRELSSEDKGFGFRVAAVTATDKMFTPRADQNYSINNTNQGILRSAPMDTVGGAGLAIRYANVIIMAEKYFYIPASINDEVRAQMYEMLPANLKQTVRGKLKSHWCKDAEEREGKALVEEWKEAVEEIMSWLAPMAFDTVRWQQERNLEKQKLDAKPSVMLLQTLHFSDLEKTEAAIVEVLVGLSYILRYENQQVEGPAPAKAGMANRW